MEAIQFIGTDPTAFKEELARIVRETLSELRSQPLSQAESSMLTRDEVATILKTTPTTIYRWTKSGKLKCHRKGIRVFYKRSDIENALIPLNS